MAIKRSHPCFKTAHRRIETASHAMYKLKILAECDEANVKHLLPSIEEIQSKLDELRYSHSIKAD